jgi:ribosomal protein S18 acetylase RimI-like enzyme
VITPDRLESYLRRAASAERVTMEIPPFVVFLDPDDPLRFFNYAHPLRPIAGDPWLLRAELATPLASLRALFVSRGRTPRFEYVEEYASGLATALADDGFVEEGRYPLQVCDLQSYRSAPAVRGLEIRQLSEGNPASDLGDFITVERQSFGHRVADAITEEDCEDLRNSMRRGGLAFLARLDGRPAGIASCTVPLDGLTELAGIATLPEYRRHGVATAVTAAAAQAAFAQGVEAAFLTAGDEQAGRVYQRVGFRSRATVLAYSTPSTP